MNYYFKIIFLFCFILTFIFSCDAEKVTFKGKYLNYGEYKIYYEMRGNSSKTLVFIHGWASSIQVWKYQLDSFPEYKVLIVDLPGNGKSSKNEESSYSMELFADSIQQILINEKNNEAFFIGHSMGFAVCEVFSQKYAGMCTGICSMDGSHFELPEDSKEKENWIKYNRDFAKSVETDTGKEYFLNLLFLADTPEMLKKEVFKISKTVPLSIGKSMIDGVEKDQKYWQKRKMKIPCLAVYSPVYQLPPDYKYELQKTYPKIEYYYIPDVSHYLMMEMPYKINQIIYDFLKKNY